MKEEIDKFDWILAREAWEKVKKDAMFNLTQAISGIEVCNRKVKELGRK